MTVNTSRRLPPCRGTPSTAPHRRRHRPPPPSRLADLLYANPGSLAMSTPARRSPGLLPAATAAVTGARPRTPYMQNSRMTAMMAMPVKPEAEYHRRFRRRVVLRRCYGCSAGMRSHGGSWCGGETAVLPLELFLDKAAVRRTAGVWRRAVVCKLEQAPRCRTSPVSVIFTHVLFSCMV